jgi:hypothetical protein
MDHGLAELWQEITARPSGRMAFRFYLQPLMATLLATRDGIRDARAGRPAYFWALFVDPVNRRARLREGWHAVQNVFVLALVLDTIYQLLVLRGLRPLQGLLVALTLAIVPYVLFRGPVSRVTRNLLRVAKRRRHSAV